VKSLVPEAHVEDCVPGAEHLLCGAHPLTTIIDVPQPSSVAAFLQLPKEEPRRRVHVVHPLNARRVSLADRIVRFLGDPPL
jgi:hypothetical protein